MKYPEIKMKLYLYSGILLIILSVAFYIAPSLSQATNQASLNEQTSSVSKVHVLVYHSVRPYYDGMSVEVKEYTVEPESFDNQMNYLVTNGYNVISLDKIALASENKYLLPEKAVVITFDDGWANQYNYAFPILKKYNLTATFFIYPNAIGHKNWMTWDNVRELVTSSMTVGSHSKSHPYLHKITNETQLLTEINESKTIIEDQLGIQIQAFAYPFGAFTESLGAHVKNAGYKLARTFAGGVYQTGDNLFSIKGIAVTNSLMRFKQVLNQ